MRISKPIIQRAAAQAGLVIDAVREPRLNGTPIVIVVVYRFYKRGRATRI